MSIIISHRGANIYCPQNTLPAFQKSAALGVHGIETDVHLTKDGVPVICHNYTVDETSTGKGAICNSTYEELLRYDFGCKFSPKYKGTKIPTLDELLDLVKGASLSVLNLELKAPAFNSIQKQIWKNNPEALKEANTLLVHKTIDAVKAKGLDDILLISSFDPALLVLAKEYDQNVKTGYLYSPNNPLTYQNKMITHPADYAKSIGADALHPMYNYVTKRYVQIAHEAGLQVNPWTINSVRMIEKMLSYGVDGIITNFPDVSLGILDKHTY